MPDAVSQELIREWSDQSGKFKVRTKFESLDNDLVVLTRSDGKQIRVPKNRLSQADHEYLAKRSSKPAVPSADVSSVKKEPLSKILEAPAEFTLTNQLLREGLAQIAKQFSINVVLSTEGSRETSSVTPATRISYAPPRQSVGEALDTILRLLQLVWCNFDDVLLVTSLENSQEAFRVYRTSQPSMSIDLIREIQTEVAAVYWIELGGNGVMFLVPPNRILVFNHAFVLRELEMKYKGKLRAVAAKAKGPSSQAGLERLISFNFQQVSVNSAISSIAQMTDSEFTIDEEAFKNAGLSSRTPVTLELSNVRAGTALELLLRPLNLCSVSKEKTIEITTQSNDQVPMTSAEYNVAGITGVNSSSLTQFISNCIDPTSWESAGENAQIRAKAPNSIIVNQMAKNHAAIKQLISDLRASSR